VTTILITGASGGLGSALARAYASAGTLLLLWGRDRARLDKVAEECRQLGAKVDVACLDISDLDAMTAQLLAQDESASIDLAILNAGLGGTVPRQALSEDPNRARAIAMVDFASPVVSASLLAERMCRRGSGHIALIGSIAESFPLPMAPTYSGAKAGLAMFAEALRLRVRKHGVAVSLISPGFIDTPMSRSVDSAKPFMLSAEKAAAIIRSQLEKKRARSVIPWPFAVIRAVYRVLPRRFGAIVLERLD
jgi:short-subunit dehydrogenase